MNIKADKKIIICATQRCGSTLVCNDFLNNGIGKPKEHFLGLVKNFNSNNSNARLNQITKAGLNEDGVFSVKLMSSYCDKINNFLVSLGYGQDTEKFWGGISRYFQDATWVYIKRDSTIRQAVSRFMSKRTGINHAISDNSSEFTPGNSIVGHDSSYNEKVGYSKQHLNKNILNIARENFLWERFFEENNIVYAKINYENIVNDISYISQIFQAANLPLKDPVNKRNLLKLANHKNEEIIKLFMEDKNHQ